MAWSQVADGEEGDESDWDAVVEGGSGTLDVSTNAKKNGSYGWEVTVTGAGDESYGDLTDPTDEVKFTGELWVNPDNLTMATNDEFWLSAADGSGAVATTYAIVLKYTGSAYQIYVGTWNDDSSLDLSAAYVISGWTQIRIAWMAATGVGEDDGHLYLYIDGVLQWANTGMDNDGYDVDITHYGIYNALDAGTSGVLYIDDCQWEGIGRHLHAPAGAVTPAGAVIKGPGKPLGGAVTPAGVITRVVAWYRSLAGTVTPAQGWFGRGTARALVGTLTPVGAIIKGPGKVLAGVLTPAGRLIQRIANFFRIWFDGSPETVARIDITATASVQLDDSPETTVILEQ